MGKVSVRMEGNPYLVLYSSQALMPIPPAKHIQVLLTKIGSIKFKFGNYELWGVEEMNDYIIFICKKYSVHNRCKEIGCLVALFSKADSVHLEDLDSFIVDSETRSQRCYFTAFCFPSLSFIFRLTKHSEGEEQLIDKVQKERNLTTFQP